LLDKSLVVVPSQLLDQYRNKLLDKPRDAKLIRLNFG
jgi:hypothetical protein